MHSTLFKGSRWADLAKALNAMLDQAELSKAYEQPGSPLEIAFLCVKSRTVLTEFVQRGD